MEVNVEVTDPPEAPPAPAAATTTVVQTDNSTAMEVGELKAKVERLETELTEARQATQSAQVTADVALSAAVEATTQPEPEPEVIAVEEVELPSPPSAAGADQEAPPKRKSLWRTVLLG